MRGLQATLAVLLVAWSATAAPPDSEVKVTRQFDRDGRPTTGHGSGTVVASGVGISRILTNFHVTPDEGRGLTVEHKGKSYPALLIAWYKAADLACLEVRAELPAVRIANDAPAAGSPCYQWGHPRASAAAVPKSGRAVGPTTRGPGRATFETTIACDHGDSGAGVFDGSGNLVGVCKAFFADNRGEACVSLADVRAFLWLDPPAITSASGNDSARGSNSPAPKVYQQMPRYYGAPDSSRQTGA